MSQLLIDGFIVIPGPIAEAEFADLSTAYDEAFTNSIEADVKHGSTSVRVNGLINRHACFDRSTCTRPCWPPLEKSSVSISN